MTFFNIFFNNLFVHENISHIFATKFHAKQACNQNKTELVSSIAAKAGLSKADSKKALDATIEAIAEALKAGDKISLVGFGTFAVAERPARQGINPATKAPISIPAKKVAKFKAGSDLESAIN